MNLEIGGTVVRAEFASPDLATSGSKERSRLRIYAALIMLDCAGMFCAFTTANLIRFDALFNPAGLNIFFVLTPIYIVTALNRNVFCSLLFSRWRTAASNATTSLMAAVTAVLFVSFYLQATAYMSRIVLSIGVLFSIAFMILVRWAVHRYADRLLGGLPLGQLLICDGQHIPRGVRGTVIDAAVHDLRPDISDPNALDKIGRLLRGSDRVIISCVPERRAAWAAVLKGANIHGEVIVPEIRAIGSLGASDFEGEPTLIVALSPLNIRNRALKRGLDLIASTAALVFLGPLMAIVAVAIRLETPGPILFVQPRLGRGNRLFAMYKFRSMRTEFCDPHGAQSTQRGDMRVTRIGRLIRATSIDELPQFLNVLKGDMSIVGPRPHALGSLAGDKLFWEVDERYGRRHAGKPGITGLAQIRGFRGATHHQSDLVDRLQADLDYLNGWTIWRDLSILLATARVLLHRNAY
jgi:lipopolysaccharide/colanic/teichoic acid biosynthesis glycosyltransferase